MALMSLPAPGALQIQKIAVPFDRSYASTAPGHYHHPGHLASSFIQPRAFVGAPFPASLKSNRARSRTGLVVAGAFRGAGPLQDGAFFDSPIVKTELNRIQNDYKHLFQIGKDFCYFDRQRKLSYIKEMKGVLERWLIFYKRMELSDDFAAKLYAKQLKSKVSPNEESNFDMVFSFYNALDDLKQEAESSI